MTVNDATSSVQRPPLGMIESSADRFVWSPPVTASARRARKRVRFNLGALVVVAAIWAVASVWADGLDAIAFALVVPLMLLGITVAVDRLFAVGEKLRIETAVDSVTVVRGRVRQLVPYDEITGLSVTKVARSRSRSGPAGWYLVIDRADAEPVSALVPVGGGSAFDRHEAAALEAELRKRCSYSSM